MNWNEYSALALRTESIPNNVYGHLLGNEGLDTSKDSPHKKATRLLHAAMGLVTETAELEHYTDQVNLVEEIGDCFWYLPIIESAYPELVLDVTIYGTVLRADAILSLRSMRSAAATLIDKIGKRHIFYGKDLENDQVKEAAVTYTYYLMRFCLMHDVEPSDAWEANIKKLEKRYPDLRFNGEHAVNRNVSNELSHIEMKEDLKLTDAAYNELEDMTSAVTVTADEFNKVLRNDFTPNEIERIAMGLAFELGQKFKKQGMDILATAMGDVYRTYSGRGDKLADSTVYGMYDMLGYPTTVVGVLSIAHSILRTPQDVTSNNSSAG